MEKKELKEKILEAMVFNSPESSAEAILDIVQQEIDRAKVEVLKEMRESINGELKLSIEIWEEFLAEKISNLNNK